MSNEDYERFQLELILQEYASRGFDVSLEAQTELGNMIFDGIVKNRESGQLVVIELVNKAQSKARASERINAIRRFAEIYPDAQVDLRYIDVERSRVRWWQEAFGENGSASIKEILSTRLPRRPTSGLSRSMYFMHVWALHAAIIRAYGRIIALLLDPPRGRGALEIYNELLRFDLLHPPEELIEGVELNLFDLHEAVLAIAEGAVVNDRYFDNLMQHFHSIRQQIRKRLKSMQKNELQ